LHAASPFAPPSLLSAVVFWASFASWFAFEMWIFSRDRRAASGDRADKGSRALIVFTVYVSMGIAFSVPYAFPGARIVLPGAPLFGVAIALIWLGIALRYWAVTTLGRFFRTSVFMQSEHRLVTQGPYKLLRHPSYAGTLVTVLGIGLANGNYVSVAAAVGMLSAAYVWRIIVEETALCQRFGDEYTNYRRRSWAFIPFVF
jgi:protein-S-isoprenylcysteine O-methyltransferase